MLEWDAAGNVDRARALFQQGASVPAAYQHPPLYQAWAEREAAAGNDELAARLHARSYEVATAAAGRGRQAAARGTAAAAATEAASASAAGIDGA